jgi:ubiquinol-cytochrome c reductase subunit 7
LRQDYPYLTNVIKEIEAEMAEREDLEAMILQKRAKNSSTKGH